VRWPNVTGKAVGIGHAVTCLHIPERASEGKTTQTHNDRLMPAARLLAPLVKQLGKARGDGPVFRRCGT
jgi:hypothetical protein